MMKQRKVAMITNKKFKQIRRIAILKQKRISDIVQEAVDRFIAKYENAECTMK